MNNRKSKMNLIQIIVSVAVSCFILASCATTGHEYSEYSPTISADGRTMIFQSDMDKRGNYKIYIKQRVLDTWSRPIPIDSINSKYADGGCFITYDQNYLIFTSNREGGHGNADLWISQRKGDVWDTPMNMGPVINSSGYEGFASLSPDGNTLYFVRECPEKAACKDKLGLYYSEKIDGIWTEPKRLPHPINSDYCEFGPIILADSITLIFSSTRPGGFGGYDLYKSEKMEGGGWSRPVNLGSFINTRHEDSLVSIPASGDIMYYTRSKNPQKEKEDKDDARRIFSVPIPENLQQTKVIVVKGVVRDKRNPERLLHAEISITDIKKDDAPIVIKSNKDDGKYIVILNKGKVCDFSVTSRGYMFHSKKIDLTNLSQYREINEDILLEPIVNGANIVLNNMYFKFRSYKLLTESKYELSRVIKLLKENPRMKVEISGHTDDIGSKNANMKLSQMRANSVVQYLVRKGISSNRLIAKGYGETKPVASNKSETGRKENRRVEIEVLSVN